MAREERSFIMIKPDAVQRGLVGAIMHRFEQRGYKLVACKMMHAPEQLLKDHYCHLASKPFFPDLIAYMHSGPVVPMVWQGIDIVNQGRSMLGATNPLESKPGSIRGDFSIHTGRNIVHGSDSVDTAKKEISMWFKPEELIDFKRENDVWIYE